MAATYRQALRAVQPEGPYLLAGSSMGGVIAYEMAQQLGEEGEEVAFLGLIDSWLLDPSIPEIGEAEAERAILAYGQSVGGLPPTIGRRELARFSAVFVQNGRPLRASGPRPYAGSRVYFRAEATLPAERPEDAWSALCGGRSEVHRVPGDHLSALFPPHVAALGARIEKILLQKER